MTAHVVIDDDCFHHGDLPAMLDRLQTCLAGHFDLAHSTVQFEPAGPAAHETPPTGPSREHEPAVAVGVGVGVKATHGCRRQSAVQDQTGRRLGHGRVDRRLMSA
jgi:hypothetical protein